MKPRKTDINSFKRRINYTLKKHGKSRQYMLTEHIGGGFCLTYDKTEYKNFVPETIIAQMLIVKQLRQMLKYKCKQQPLNL
ncbi:MAG TPA: hypothetical protein DCQ31_08425 [Bacteroidales bacterium]|nr:hypothetical protein [Bacteroidales bacterium]